MLVFVPSTGVSYLNRKEKNERRYEYAFSSPLRGSLISMGDLLMNNIHMKRFRPLYGGLLSQSCPLHLPKHKAFIPHLRGKPANERNLNIKLVYNILKA